MTGHNLGGTDGDRKFRSSLFERNERLFATAGDLSVERMVVLNSHGIEGARGTSRRRDIAQLVRSREAQPWERTSGFSAIARSCVFVTNGQGSITFETVGLRS